MADTLALLDGNALLYRAFHALPALTSPKGELTNAVYGFTMMLLRGIHDLHPTHVAAAFDTPQPTFRHQRFEAYKGNRAPMPTGLPSQFPRVYELLEAFRIPVYRIDGLEADDILGTLAERASASGMDVVIITGDTDALQLVRPKVRVLVPRRGLTDTVLYDEAAVRERYGLEPAQLADYRALRGDASDNIPSVPGIGDKTAAKLLATHQDVDGILLNLDKIPAKLAEQVRSYTDQVKMALHLAQIVRDAPIEFDPGTCLLRPPDRERTLALFHELGFRSLIDRIPPAGVSSGAFEATEGEQLATPTAEGERVRARGPDDHTAGVVGAPQPLLFDMGDSPSGSAANAMGAVVQSLDELRSLAEELRASGGPVSIVHLLDRPDAMRGMLLGIAFARTSPALQENGDRETNAFYVPFGGAADGGVRPLPLAEGIDVMRPLLEGPDVPKASPNMKQLTVVLARHGITLRGGAFDSGLAAYLVESSQRTLTLQDLSWSRLNRELPGLKSVTGDGRAARPAEAVSIGRLGMHVCREVETLAQVQPILEREVVEGGLEDLYRQVELPLVAVLAAMERAGVAVDVPYLMEFSRELHERIAAVEAATYDAVGHQFNINSSQQLATVLFDELHLPAGRRTATGRASTAADALTSLRGTHPVVDLILEHREMTKLKSTYVDALPLLVNPDTGRTHTTFHQTVAATGRLSSTDPNLQNLPVRTELGRRVRRAFVAPAPDWKLLSADYSQIELRIQAHLTQDPTLLEAFQAGEDVHAATAAELFSVPMDGVTRDQRGLAKTANFAIIYGISPFGFSEQTGMPQQQAAEFIRRYFERFRGVEEFQKRLLQEARSTCVVTTLLGRKRTIPELRSQIHGVRAAGERMAINAPVQGTASDIIKVAMVRLSDEMAERGMRARLLLQVHDELLFEVPDAELETLKAVAKDVMENAVTLSVPLVVEFRAAENWGALY